MMRIAICDDDADFTKTLKSLLEKGFDKLNIVPVVSVYNDGAAFIQDNGKQAGHDSATSDSSGYDAVFLDVDMPVINGFDIAGQINRMGETRIVFVTMHDELVYSSIKFQPFRFIRKSHLESELPEVLDALDRAVLKHNAGKRFKFQTKTGEVFLDINNIEYIEIYGHWLHVCVDGGEDIECYGSLSEFEEQLAPFDFIRTHKSYLVNCKYIYSIEKNRIILDDKTEIFLSRYRANEVRNKFKDYIRSEL